jgi:ADP-ribose pyrophosphatase YjhB (NUDIX family)
MNKIYFDSDSNFELTPELENIKSFDEFLYEYLDTIQKLSGIMVIVDDKILLVKPQKLKEELEKWSIPKGKMEKDHTVIENAIRELQEETGIVISEDQIEESDKTKIFYKKSGRIRELTTYIVRLNKEDLQININRRWSVHKKHFDTDEVFKAKFFTKEEAINKIEAGQMPLLKFI